MRLGLLVLMVAAVASGLVSGYLSTRSWAVESERQDRVGPQPPVKVFTAKRKLLALTALNKAEDLFVEKYLPAELVPDKAVTSLDQLNGRLNKVIEQDGIVTTDDFISKELDGGRPLAKQRAMTIPIKQDDIAGGFATTGCWVEIVGTRDDCKSKLVVILKSVEVLARDLWPVDKVTVAVWPEEAGRLKLALAGGLDLRILLVPRP